MILGYSSFSYYSILAYKYPESAEPRCGVISFVVSYIQEDPKDLKETKEFLGLRLVVFLRRLRLSRSTTLADSHPVETTGLLALLVFFVVLIPLLFLGIPNITIIPTSETLHVRNIFLFQLSFLNFLFGIHDGHQVRSLSFLQILLEGLKRSRFEGLRAKGSESLLFVFFRFFLFELFVLFGRHTVGNVAHCKSENDEG